MQRRTLYALTAAALLVVTGTAFAQTQADSNAVDARPYYALKIFPAEARIAAGETHTFRVHVESARDTALTLSIHAPDALRVSLDATDVKVPADGGYSFALTVAAGADAHRGVYGIGIAAKDANGQTAGARAKIAIVAPHDGPIMGDRAERPQPERPTERPEPVRYSERPTTPPAEPNRPHDRPTDRASDQPADRPRDAKPNDRDPYAMRLEMYERRANALEGRLNLLLLRIERQLAHLEEQDRIRPLPPVQPPVAPHVKLTLADENVVVPDEGRRVALLIEAGDKGGRVPLHLRYDTASGWGIELDKKGVHVQPDGRTWVWVVFKPGQTASVDYVVYAGDANDASLGNAVKGTASANSRMA